MNMWESCEPGMSMSWMWVFPLLFFLVMIGMMFMFWRRGGVHWCGMMGHQGHETPRQILDRRYASGEITKEQFDEMRHNLA